MKCRVPWCVEHSTDPDLCFGPTLDIEGTPAGAVTLMHDPQAGTLVSFNAPFELPLTDAQTLGARLQAALTLDNERHLAGRKR